MFTYKLLMWQMDLSWSCSKEMQGVGVNEGLARSVPSVYALDNAGDINHVCHAQKGMCLTGGWCMGFTSASRLWESASHLSTCFLHGAGQVFEDTGGEGACFMSPLQVLSSPVEGWGCGWTASSREHQLEPAMSTRAIGLTPTLPMGGNNFADLCVAAGFDDVPVMESLG